MSRRPTKRWPRSPLKRVNDGLLAFAVVLLIALANLALAQDIPVPTPRPDPQSDAGAPPVQTEEQAAPPAQADLPIIHRAACAALMTGQVEGRLAAPIRDGECGEDSPLQLVSAGGVNLTGDPLTRCGMAEGLARFAQGASEAARDILGTELTTIITGPGYQCRRRNRASVGKLSEHAFANALDIAGFELADGRKVTVGGDWPHIKAAAPSSENGGAEEANGESGETGEQPSADVNEETSPLTAAQRASTPEAKFLVAVRDKACAVFTTVLSPDSNTAHHSHLHFDLGCHGKNCTYLICE